MAADKDSSFRVRKRLYLLLYLAYLIGVGVFLFVSFLSERKELLESFDQRLLVAAKSLKHMLRPDFHDRAVAPDAISFAEELENRRRINAFAKESGFVYVYTLVAWKGKFYFSAPTVTEAEARQKESWFFYPYDDIPAAFVEAFERKQTRFVSYADQWGEFRSVAHPEVTELGRSYLACADLKIQDFNKLLWRRNLFNLGIGMVFLLMSVPFIFLYRRDNRSLIALNRDLNLRTLDLERMVLTRTLDLSQARRERVRAEREYRRLFDEAVVGIFRLAADGRLLLANPKLAELLGYASPAALLAETALDSSLFSGLPEHADSAGVGENRRFNYRETEFVKNSGDKIWVSISSRMERDGTGRVLYWEGFVMDITDRKRYEEDIRRMALEDFLTGLPNRKSFMEALSKKIKAQGRNPEVRFAVLMIDLDDFKAINDTWGHLFGDRYLAAVAKRMLAAVRPDDAVARLGGDEFAVLLADLACEEEAREVAERLIQEISRPIDIEGRMLQATASVGGVMGAGDPAEAADLLRDADSAMYQAKGEGKNRVFFLARKAAPS